MSSTVYLLSVGINTYQSYKISNLKECRNDVFKFQQALLDLNLVEEDNCISLCDEKATREKIITTFRSHFNQMADGDIAVFYFSGHGASDCTSKEFIAYDIEPKHGKNENLVPHDSFGSAVYNIADKELRWLVSEIQKDRPNSTFIAILDCCHAGSALKYDNVRLKTCPGYPESRPLDAYLEGQYADLLAQTQDLILPSINYISLAACSSEEQAWEDKYGGLFTNALVEFLKNRNGRVTYAELNSLSHIYVQNQKKYRQNPTLEYTEGVNPFQYFLKNELPETPHLPILHYAANKWFVSLGAIHNITETIYSGKKLFIYKKGDFTNAIGSATLSNVSLEKSTVIPEWNALPPSKSEKLYLGLYPQRLPIRLKMDQASDHSKDLIKQYSENENFNSQFLIDSIGKYEIRADQNGMYIFKRINSGKSFIIGIKEQTQRTINWLNHQLRMIAKWENILTLQTPKNSNLSPRQISLFFTYWYPNEMKIEASAEFSNDFIQHIEIPLTKEKNAIYYSIDVSHQYHSTNGLFFYLVHLDRTYKIKQKTEDISNNLMKNIRKTLYNSYHHGCGLGIADSNIASVEDHFILIAAKTPLTNASYFDQDGFGGQYGKVMDSISQEKSRGTENYEDVQMQHWCVKKLIVKLIATS